MYLVVEYTTASAPSSSGCCSTGDAKVLSTTTLVPCACATAEVAAMSAMPSNGLDGVSTQIYRYCLFASAADTAAVSVMSTTSRPMPHGTNTLASRR